MTIGLIEHYRYHGSVVDGERLLHTKGVVVCSHVSILVAVLLRKATKLPIFVLAGMDPRYHRIEGLLNRNHIALINKSQLAWAQQRGLVLIRERDYEQFHAQFKSPVRLAYICGADHVRYSDGRWSQQWLLAKVQAYDGQQALPQAMARLGAFAWHEYVDTLPGVAELWLHQAKMGGKRLAVADSTGVSLSQERFLVAVMSLRERLQPLLEGQERVGVCLPPSVAGCTTTMVLMSLGKTMVNLNYTAAPTSLQAAIEEAEVKTILTSYRFVDTLKKKGFDVTEVFASAYIIYLEDIKRELSKLTLLANLLRVKLLPFSVLKRRMITPVKMSDVAAILFSSGSEGKPKGVELTQRNLVGNCKQAAAMMEANGEDVILGLLPIFHAFGLTATTLLPLMEGVPVVCHPDPRDAVAIGHLCQQYRGTIMCGTSTFFRLYAKSRGLTPEMFSSLRYVVAGAERLLPEVRQMFEEKFAKKIYEGYGTTELTPVVSSNRPDQSDRIGNKPGTIGLLIAGCLARIVDPETNATLPLGEAGMLAIAGVNVMKGYLNNPAKTAEVIFESDGLRWYKTGDKAVVDADGFITILDRYSRFAKLGGEMVSLAAVENQISEILNDSEIEILAVAVPDIRKGENVIVLFAGPCTEDHLRYRVTESAMNNLMKPQAYFHVEAIPKLGTGKTDFAAAKKLAVSLVEKGAEL